MRESGTGLQHSVCGLTNPFGCGRRGVLGSWYAAARTAPSPRPTCGSIALLLPVSALVAHYSGVVVSNQLCSSAAT
jgi:hypothetical protein